MKILKQLKLGDLAIIAILVLISFVPVKVLLTARSTGPNVVAIIKVNNRQVKKLSLNQDTTWTYKQSGKVNVVQVKKQRIRMIDANCKDQVCVKEGWKSKAEDTIVCLPHKFLVELKDESVSNETDE
ncbi:NusG domain II-containing protein [Lactobacillus sp. XV13L]|nr:NusG domain II-containing protein [Lactobacillus sp. XV13L]